LEIVATEWNAARAAGDAHAELELAFKADWVRCDWFDPMVVSRFKIDLVRRDLATKTLYIVDIKTGKLRAEASGEYQDQISLYSLAFGTLMTNRAHEWLEALSGGDWTIKASLFFTDFGQSVEGKGLTPAEFPALKATMEARVNRLLTDTDHIPTPGPACRWCPWGKKKSGDCKFG
jgi:hypothetical protein